MPEQIRRAFSTHLVRTALAVVFCLINLPGDAVPPFREQHVSSNRGFFPLWSKKSDAKDAYASPLRSQKGIIVLDPGHGGEDTGTKSLTTPKYQEKFLTLSTSLLIKNYLQQMGYVVKMTRHKDIFIPLDKRSFFANTTEPALFVSVHYNSAPSKDAEGIEIFYYKNDENKARTKSSHRLADTVLKRMIQTTQAKSRGVKHGNFSVIRETKMPAILVEGGFLTNQSEMERIKDPEYLKKLAWGVAQGVDDYLSTLNLSN